MNLFQDNHLAERQKRGKIGNHLTKGRFFRSSSQDWSLYFFTSFIYWDQGSFLSCLKISKQYLIFERLMCKPLYPFIEIETEVLFEFFDSTRKILCLGSIDIMWRNYLWPLWQKLACVRPILVWLRYDFSTEAKPKHIIHFKNEILWYWFHVPYILGGSHTQCRVRSTKSNSQPTWTWNMVQWYMV